MIPECKLKQAAVAHLTRRTDMRPLTESLLVRKISHLSAQQGLATFVLQIRNDRFDLAHLDLQHVARGRRLGSGTWRLQASGDCAEVPVAYALPLLELGAASLLWLIIMHAPWWGITFIHVSTQLLSPAFRCLYWLPGACYNHARTLQVEIGIETVRGPTDPGGARSN